MAIELYKGEPIDIPVVFPSDPLIPHGYTWASVTDVSMCLKRDTENDTDAQWMQKTMLGGGVTLDVPNHTITLAIGVGDYTGLPPNEYELVVACQTNGPDEWVELRMADARIIIEMDKHRT